MGESPPPLATNCCIFPIQIEDEAGVTITVAGVGFTVTGNALTAEVHPLAVAVKLYIPDSVAVTPEILGFCKLEVNPLGPDQINVDPALFVDPMRLNVAPTQTGLLKEAMAVGVCFTATATDAVAVCAQISVIVRL